MRVKREGVEEDTRGGEVNDMRTLNTEDTKTRSNDLGSMHKSIEEGTSGAKGESTIDCLPRCKKGTPMASEKDGKKKGEKGGPFF